MSNFQTASTDFIDEETLLAANFDVKKLKDDGYSLRALLNCCFSISQLREAGFTSLSLRCAGIGCRAQRDGGYTSEEVFRIGGFTNQQLYDAGYRADELREELNFSCDDLKECGYSANDQKMCGFLVNDLKASGYTSTEIAACSTPGEMMRAGYGKDVLKPMGMWRHDGTWEYYNSYWSCCHSINQNSKFCVASTTDHTLEGRTTVVT